MARDSVCFASCPARVGSAILEHSHKEKRGLSRVQQAGPAQAYLPLIIEQFLAVMVGMADIMMVSSAGEAAVSSVALVDLINVLIINIFAALATGGAVVCAQSIGAQNLERANRAANQLLYIVTAAALGIMVLVLFCKAGLLGLLFGQVEPEVMEGAVTYFVISALSYPFIAVYNGCAALLRAMGNSKASMCVSAYMNGQNIAGNAVFVFVFHQGVAGVALSSLLSRIAAPDSCWPCSTAGATPCGCPACSASDSNRRSWHRFSASACPTAWKTASFNWAGCCW